MSGEVSGIRLRERSDDGVTTQLTLRDLFAAFAMNAQAPGLGRGLETGGELAALSYRIADAMLAERERAR